MLPASGSAAPWGIPMAPQAYHRMHALVPAAAHVLEGQAVFQQTGIFPVGCAAMLHSEEVRDALQVAEVANQTLRRNRRMMKEELHEMEVAWSQVAPNACPLPPGPVPCGACGKLACASIQTTPRFFWGAVPVPICQERFAMKREEDFQREQVQGSLGRRCPRAPARPDSHHLPRASPAPVPRARTQMRAHAQDAPTHRALTHPPTRHSLSGRSL